MSKRILFKYNLYGFRSAVDCDYVKKPWKIGLDAIEKTVKYREKCLMELSYDVLSKYIDDPGQETHEIYKGRGGINIYAEKLNDNALEVLIFGALPRQYWPIGYWCVLTGFIKHGDNSVTALSDTKLDECW